MAELDQLHADVLGTFMGLSQTIVALCVDTLSLEAAEAIEKAMDAGATITLSTTLSGPPAVFGYLTWRDGRPAQEVFRLMATPDNKVPIWN